ncbi:hypothetical protein Tsubulata_012215 [Turnera subulata]|uniref:Peptidase A1 domain-containing protein n=1 Tax=Turnera subulata TaxID=218843 RepID=A0A9Q0FIV8_9ROSI|nr:hypothetical protein Tsubulata_012215 [Turnera subulata]
MHLYGDGSLTERNLVQDSVMVGNGVIYRFVFGCGHSNVMEVAANYGGILGLGRGRVSIINQISTLIGGVLSYCLATSANPSPGWITMPISEDVFNLRKGKGGVILDTGTTLTTLPQTTYKALRDAYLAQTASIPRVLPVHPFEVCYIITLHFDGGLVLPPMSKNIFITMDGMYTWCLALLPSTFSFSIIGNIQQKYSLIIINTLNGQISFTPSAC